ncbi:hypothetical protein D3C85_1464260 [compost metagenome]
MTPWAWYWKHEDDESYGEECPSRDAVIAAAHRELRQGDPFEIIEARMSESLEHEGSDFIPFLRSRNHESLTALSTPDALKGDAK